MNFKWFRSRSRRLAITAGVLSIVGAAVVSVSAAGADRGQPSGRENDEPTRRRMTSEEIPEDAYQPSQPGNGSVESFSAFLDGVNDMNDGLVLGAPISVDDLAAMSQVVAQGRVAEVALVRSDVHMGELSAAQIEMVITVTDPAIIKTSASVSAVDTWRQQLWLGDPVLADRVLEMLQTELGSGPVGADAVLFGSIDQTAERNLPTPSVLDGLITLDGSVARLAPSPQTAGDTTETLDAFSDARSVVAAIQER